MRAGRQSASVSRAGFWLAESDHETWMLPSDWLRGPVTGLLDAHATHTGITGEWSLSPPVRGWKEKMESEQDLIEKVEG